MKKVLSFLFFLSLCISMFISTIDFCCFDRSFYEREYEKSKTADRIGVTDENLEKLTDVVLDYLKSDRDSMSIRLTVNNRVQEVFTNRAKLHMIDVRNLYDGVISIRNITAVIALLCLILIVCLKTDINVLHKAYFKVLLLLFGFFAFIGCFALIDFNTFWIGFHKLLFTNDLWLLDYSDVLVNMVNATFFFDLVIRIVIYILIELTVICLIMIILKRRKMHEN